MSLRIAVLIFLCITSGLANAESIPCSLKKFSVKIDQEMEPGFSAETVRKMLIDCYGIDPVKMTQHTYATPATLNTRKGEVAGVKWRLNVILRQCHPASAFFFETWFSGIYYFNDQGQLINDEYFYTVDAL